MSRPLIHDPRLQLICPNMPFHHFPLPRHSYFYNFWQEPSSYWYSLSISFSNYSIIYKSKNVQYLFFSLWLPLLNMTHFSTIKVAENVLFLPFLWLYNLPLFFKDHNSISAHLLVDNGDVFILWLLYKELQWKKDIHMSFHFSVLVFVKTKPGLR